MSVTETIQILDPTGAVEIETRPLAPRPKDLRGLRVGFLDNGKPNNDLLQQRLEELLQDRFFFSQVTRRVKQGDSSAATPAPPEMLAELVANCDVIVNGMGD